MKKRAEISLYTAEGQRKYITENERKAVIEAAHKNAEIGLFVLVLAYTGCRISEALNLTQDNIDANAQCIVFESLKKRRKGVYRAVPVPEWLIERLNGLSNHHLFPMGRTTAWEKVKALMLASGIPPAQAHPKAFRHGLGVLGVMKGLPVSHIQKLLGHSSSKTTEIYASAQGQEERKLAEILW